MLATLHARFLPLQILGCVHSDSGLTMVSLDR